MGFWIDFKKRFMVSIGTKCKFTIRGRVRHRTSIKRKARATVRFGKRVKYRSKIRVEIIYENCK